MNQYKISGAQLRDMVIVGAALLEKNKQAIDALNVFPVPDGDTGTNMYMTMQSAVRELQKVSETATVSEVADALSMGALRGARGNSGVILSQLFRGFSKALKGAETMDAAQFSDALTKGSEAAYKAVMRPKEGTILTVSRVIAESVAELAKSGANVYRLMDGVLESGEKALLQTPEQLPVLKEAGVVDSGGKGLLTIYRGFKLSLDGEDAADFEEIPMEAAAISSDSELTEESITYGYCTEFFIIHLNSSFRESDLDRFREHLTRIGDSVVAAYDSDMIKVHVHSDAPGKVLQMALRFGELDHLKIENMREQNRELQAERKRNEKEYAMIAVSAGAGLDEVFKELAVDHIITGGQTMNPSIEDILDAVEKVGAKNVFVLPNNSNVILAASQAAELSERNVIVLPTKNVAMGIGAVVAFNPEASVEENREAMTAAAEQVKTGQITFAVRDTVFEDKEIKEGDIIGIHNGRIEVVGQNIHDIALDLVKHVVEDGDSLITIYYGQDTKQEDAEALGAEVAEMFSDLDVEVQYGGQPLYYYLISAE